MDAGLFISGSPGGRIALRPASPRDKRPHAGGVAELWPDGRLEHRYVRDLPDYLRSGDAVLINDAKVIPARPSRGWRKYRVRPGPPKSRFFCTAAWDRIATPSWRGQRKSLHGEAMPWSLAASRPRS